MKTFAELKIGDTLYCLFGTNTIVPITIKHIIKHIDLSITFIGSKERLIGYKPSWDYNWDNIRWHVDFPYLNFNNCLDASTTLQGANKALREYLAKRNSYYRRLR